MTSLPDILRITEQKLYSLEHARTSQPLLPRLHIQRVMVSIQLQNLSPTSSLSSVNSPMMNNYYEELNPTGDEGLEANSDFDSYRELNAENSEWTWHGVDGVEEFMSECGTLWPAVATDNWPIEFLASSCTGMGKKRDQQEEEWLLEGDSRKRQRT
ncbi:uncharacterized protein VTP21DRAFT_25 [Calcarisporiella thermophila]|uniref:uncharacterized protein n=1 Tax=Calcarisporiella thermophila TaxID=911321 RepID=UPI003743F05B